MGKIVGKKEKQMKPFSILKLYLSSGPNCEIDITVCNTTEKRCSNGGQCIEGLGEAFFCYCPVGE